MPCQTEGCTGVLLSEGFNCRRKGKMPPNMFIFSDGLFSLVVCMSYRCSSCHQLFDDLDLQEGVPLFVRLKLPTYNAYGVSDRNGMHRWVDTPRRLADTVLLPLALLAENDRHTCLSKYMRVRMRMPGCLFGSDLQSNTNPSK